jgi:predicted aldo/keto reductase-like oxidoreductase
MTLSTRRLGRTGHHSSVVILGGAMFWNASEATTTAAFESALEAGVNHVDIAPSYGHAEIVAGPLVTAHRAQLFVGEKTGRRDPDGVRAQLETSLSRLGCESFDLYQVHGVTDLDDLDTRADAFEAILRARDEGLTRFVGITGHDLGTAAAQLEAVRRYDLDTVMLPVYPRVLADPDYAADLAALLQECARRDVGVMAIKVGAWRPWGDREKTALPWYEPFADAEHLHRAVRFTLSTPGVHACCTPGDPDLLPLVLAAAEAYEPMPADERTALVEESATWDLIFPLEANAR